MATSPLNPMLQSVLLYQHHQTTTPFAPAVATFGSASAASAIMAQDSPVKEKEREPEQQGEEENGEEQEEDNGKEHK